MLLHGWPQTWYAWRKVIPMLAEDFDVIVPDLRGFGRHVQAQWRLRQKTVAHDVRRLVEALGRRPGERAGHDVGAAVAYAYAAQWPDDVRTMSLSRAACRAFRQEGLMDVANGGSWHFGFNMASDISEELVRGRERILIEYWMRRTTVGVVDPTSVEPDALDQYARAMAQPGGLRGSFAHYRALPQDRTDNEELGRMELPMPVLAVEGVRGQAGHSISTMKKVADNVKSAVIARAGHYPAEENPVELTAVLRGFVNGG